ncbi:hypothetical protein Moror_9200 [Moniliophthora roreri MCA 2997]|uniref:Uncharacterized protein n=2 Tax=Moniliophthora roreri TaxID=221103 RepID=V2Y008_MONRO|nr:hypothetical protein Moror_9200 [Moniliophthora roreri MCA 2997]KAI3621055.1 hypothetical protein WG66_003256 [Moniliophthora roreri]
MPFQIPYLPFEIVSAIFEHHPDLKQVRECSLVCRAWVSFTRAHGFRRIHIRSGAHIGKLFLICEESKLETLSSIKPREVVFTGVPGLGTSWQAQRFMEMFGDSIYTLRLEGRSWERIPRETLEFIQEWFATTRIRRLEIVGCRFPSSDVYAAFVQSFRCLQAFESTKSSYQYQHSHFDFGQPLIDMSGITDLDLGSENWGHPKTFGLFVGCTTVRTLRIRPSTVLRSSASTGEAASIQRILRETGEHLGELDVDVQYWYCPELVTALEERHLFTSLDLTMNTNLRKLRLAVRFGNCNISPVRIDYVLPILKRLVKVPRPTVRGLEVLDLPFMIDYESLDWAAIDRILQHPSFWNLKEVRCTGFICCFTEKDCASGSDCSIPSPDSAPGKLARGLIEKLQARLPRCRDRGILVVRVTYQFLVTPVDEQGLERPKGYVNNLLADSLPNKADERETVAKHHKTQGLVLTMWNWGKRKLS